MNKYKIFADIQKEYNELKYLSELADEATYYYATVITNIFDGICDNIGVNPDTIADKPPTMFIKGYIDGIKDIKKYLKNILFRDKPEKFTIKELKILKKSGKLTDKELKKLERQINDYINKYGSKIAERMSVKGVLLALATAELEKKKQNPKDYGMKSYEQIEKEYYKGKLPDTIQEAKTRGYTDKTIEMAIKDSNNRIAYYLSNVNDKVKNAVREKVIQAVNEGKTAKELASDLYWMKKEDAQFKKVDPNTAQMLMRDWHRVAITELMYAHAQGKMALYEKQAKESIDNPKLAVYYVFTGGTCDWCMPRHGTIVRHIPKSIVEDENNDSLQSMGIKDKYTDIAVWMGKNNIGFKKPAWRVCTPAHPYNTAILVRIYPDTQMYDAKSGRVIHKISGKYLPKEIEKRQKEIEKERDKIQKQMEKDRAKGKHENYTNYVNVTPESVLIGTDTSGHRIVSYKNNTYVEVPSSEYNERLREWRNNKHLPIPVEIGSNDHKIIFNVK